MVGDVHDGLSVSQMCGIRNRVAVSESAECRALPVLCLECDTGQLTAEASRASSCTQTQVRDAREERRDRPGGQEAQEKGRRRQGV